MCFCNRCQCLIVFSNVGFHIAVHTRVEFGKPVPPPSNEDQSGFEGLEDDVEVEAER